MHTLYLIHQTAGGDNGVLNVLGGNIFTVGQHDDILEPTRNDQVACTKKKGRRTKK